MSVLGECHRSDRLRRAVALWVAACAVAATVRPASATLIVFNGSLGDLAASATFDTSGKELIVTLANTSAADVMVPADVLTAVFFDLKAPDPISLSPVSAVVGPGSSVLFGGTDPGGVVGGEWAYADDLSGAPGDARYGISSAGFGLFGPYDLFPGNNLQGAASPNGLEYGITSAGDDPATGNKPVTGTNALIQNQVTFTLSGLPDGFDPAAQITRVYWQYGTDLSEPGFHVPEPATLALFALGVITTTTRRPRR